ncbi:respiratory nitrate reductase subunit gamma [Desulfobotulus sp. H1]|uniref:Respiratory nitrate reductase subunit gamma n=1 Tax=Desulfobotulus pelophilus TaxID=2823377 RepID=A0ABT3N852_9BACT|nr:nitrate reductase [Desulfobotulus pelophilus]MCW7753630.1 respiratory nitrate reductase subunit gamma [Desulfobotulus pelophilus]
MTLQTLYAFIAGPLAVAAIIGFVIGCVYRITMAVRQTASDRMVIEYFHPRYALRSILRWLTPFATVNMRRHPIMTVVTFVFHLGMVVMPFLIFAHMIMVYEAFGLSWPTLPDVFVEWVSWAVLLALLFFMGRRLILPEVRYLTTVSDYLILILIALPFLTGIWAFKGWWAAEWITLLHMLSGEILLVAIPFTRLGHMVLFFMTRGYMGSEFGGIRHARDW